MPSDPRRSVLVDQVRRRRPVDAREEAARREILGALGRLEDPWGRHADTTHLTGSGIVTGPRGVLLHLHRRLGLWIQPGGHLEAGEQPWDAALRESSEETGLDLRLLSDPMAPAGSPPALCHLDVHPAGGHVHLDLRYRLTAVGDDRPRPPSAESQEVRWTGWDEAVAIADPGLSGYLARLRVEQAPA